MEPLIDSPDRLEERRGHGDVGVDPAGPIFEGDVDHALHGVKVYQERLNDLLSLWDLAFSNSEKPKDVN